MSNKIIYDVIKNSAFEWHKSQPRYSDRELLKIFPDIIPNLPQILTEQENRLKKIERSVKKQLKTIQNNTDEMTRWLKEWGLEHYEIIQILKLEKNIRFLSRLLDLASGKKIKEGYLIDEDFRNAKERSIVEVVEPLLEKIKKVGNIYMACCPFHEDSTPSLAIYPNSNTFKCFGCNLGGNLIKFIMLFYNLDFINTVKWLKEN